MTAQHDFGLQGRSARDPGLGKVRTRALIFTFFTLAAAFGAGAVARATTAARDFGLASALLGGGFAFALFLVWLSRRMWMTRSRVEPAARRILVERRNWLARQHRWIGFDQVAEVVLREHRDSDGDLLRGLPRVLRAGERVELPPPDQPGGARSPPLADAIREMVHRPGGPSPPPSPPRA